MKADRLQKLSLIDSEIREILAVALKDQFDVLNVVLYAVGSLDLRRPVIETKLCFRTIKVWINWLV
jgi:hypothetical protein